MAHSNTFPHSMNSSRRSSTIIPIENQLAQESYEYEFMRLMEEERQLLAAHRLSRRESVVGKPNPYQPLTHPQQQVPLQQQFSHLQLQPQLHGQQPPLQLQQQPSSLQLSQQQSSIQIPVQQQSSIQLPLQQQPQPPLQIPTQQQSPIQLSLQQQPSIQLPLQQHSSIQVQQHPSIQLSQQPSSLQLQQQQQPQPHLQQQQHPSIQLSQQQSSLQLQQQQQQQQPQPHLQQQQHPSIQLPPQHSSLQQQQPQQLQQQRQQQQYYPSSDDRYTNTQAQASATLPRRVLPFLKPLRIVIIRHAERADAVLGSDWSKKSFDRSGRYIRFSEHLPDALPTRSYLHHYVIDVPLTNRGRMHAYKTGKALQFNGYAADICYTSPSLRCVQSADGILNGMDRKTVPMQLEPGLFECYLNDFKRTLCFMTKDELAANNYNIDKSYQSLMPFMRPHDSQLDYYERCRVIMDVITERHMNTGGTILIVAHAPSLEGLTRHLSGGKLQPEKLFDIARRVPFLAMTIVEKSHINSPWLFRTQPLQTGSPQSIPDNSHEITQTSAQLPPSGVQQSLSQQKQQQQQQQQKLSSQQFHPGHFHLEQQSARQNGRPRITSSSIPIDPKKVVKSSTAPNLPTNGTKHQ
ncbi:unnamed protein product [Adineta ricciae]|uniref:Uncharacterized protein n=1 Tax=Adineta ricciae TaxID=249248 RepID=A0A814P7K5_ADIRI|nr:unnamed protein product [Adineta ricciae]